MAIRSISKHYQVFIHLSKGRVQELAHTSLIIYALIVPKVINPKAALTGILILNVALILVFAAPTVILDLREDRMFMSTSKLDTKDRKYMLFTWMLIASLF